MKSSQSLFRLVVSSLCLWFSIGIPFAQKNTQQEGLTSFKTRKVVRDGKYDIAIIANFTYHEQYPELQKYVSKRFFKMENASLQVAYENYANTLGDIINYASVSTSGQAEFYKLECLGGVKDLYQNYFLTYSKDRLDESGKAMTTKSSSRHFVYDVIHQKVLTLTDVFKPEKAEELNSIIGKSTAQMEMNEQSISISYKKGGKLEKMNFSYKTQKDDFADNFCQLIDLAEKAITSNISEQVPKPANTEESKGSDAVEQMPSFNGGATALLQYLNSNVKYPIEAEENGIQGRVVVQFHVECDGSITNVTVSKSVHPSLDKEAIRVVKSMPKWNPAMLNGKPVRVKFTIPVTFGLK